MAYQENTKTELVSMLESLFADKNKVNTCLWVGYEVSRLAGHPSKTELAAKLYNSTFAIIDEYTPFQDFSDSDFQRSDFMVWLAYYCEKNGLKRSIKTLKRIYSQIPQEFSSLHKKLIRLNWNTIYSIGFDQYFIKATESSNLLSCDGQDYPGLFSIFGTGGDFDELEELINKYKNQSRKVLDNQYPFFHPDYRENFHNCKIIYLGYDFSDIAFYRWLEECRNEGIEQPLENMIAVYWEDNSFESIPEKCKAALNNAGLRVVYFDEYEQLERAIDEILHKSSLVQQDQNVIPDQLDINQELESDAQPESKNWIQKKVILGTITGLLLMLIVGFGLFHLLTPPPLQTSPPSLYIFFLTDFRNTIRENTSARREKNDLRDVINNFINRLQTKQQSRIQAVYVLNKSRLVNIFSAASNTQQIEDGKNRKRIMFTSSEKTPFRIFWEKTKEMTQKMDSVLLISPKLFLKSEKEDNHKIHEYFNPKKLFKSKGLNKQENIDFKVFSLGGCLSWEEMFKKYNYKGSSCEKWEKKRENDENSPTKDASSYTIALKEYLSRF